MTAVLGASIPSDFLLAGVAFSLSGADVRLEPHGDEADPHSQGIGEGSPEIDVLLQTVTERSS